MIDPITAITTISAGLKLVDQFRELTLRFLGRPVTPPGTIAEQSGQALQLKANGNVYEQVPASALRLDQWDQVWFAAVNKRLTTNWALFSNLYAQLPLLAGLQAAQVNQQMEDKRQELCGDFREVVGLYERALGISLPDHYRLFEVCGN